MEAKRERLLAVIFWAAFGFVAFKYMRHPIHDGDTWWHLANGRYILEHRIFLRQDIFSHTLNGTPWINFEWLGEIVMAVLVKMGGIPALFATKALLGLTSVALLVVLLRIAGASGPLLFFLSWIGYRLLQTRLCTRIELVTLNFVPLFAILIFSLPKATPAFRRKIPWLLFGLMVVWCNAHAGFIYGLLLLACFSAGSRWARWPTDLTALVDRSFMLALLAIFVTPFGPRLVEPFLVHAVDFRAAGRLIAEWDPPTIASARLFVFVAALTVLFAVRALITRQETRLWIPAVAISLVMALSTQRSIPLFTFVAIPFLAAVVPRPNARANAFIGLAALVLMIFVERDYFVKPLPPGLVDPSTMPAAACDFVKRNEIRGTMYNSYGFGGPIEWELGPERLVFMDGRYIFYPLLAEDQTLMKGRVGDFRDSSWRAFFDRHRVDYALVRYEPLRLMRNWAKPFKHESVLNMMFPRTDWALVYWDDNALVFLRRVPKFASLIERQEYRYVWPYDVEAMYNALTAHELAPSNIRKDLLRHEKDQAPGLRDKLIERLVRHAPS